MQIFNIRCIVARCPHVIDLSFIKIRTVYKQVREKYYQHSQLSHILINAPKQYIFNFLHEKQIFN